jgi:uncharacterized protein DUF5666/flagellar hook capping protein FlgD
MFQATHSNLHRKVLLFFMSAFLFTVGQVMADDSHFETKGAIQSIGADSLVVNGFIFDVNDSTMVKDDSLGHISYSDLMAGDYVKVEGYEQGAGRYYAKKIERESKSDDDDHGDDHGDDRELETKGPISALGDSTVTVNGYTFSVTSATRIKAGHNRVFSFEDLQVGNNVEVEGYWQADSALIAKKIELREHKDEDGDDVEFSGVIDSVLSNAIALNNRIIEVNDSTLIELRHDVIGSFSDLQAGMFVEVKAIVFDSALVAVRIKVENDDEKEMEITGSIDSVGVDFIELLGYHVIIDDRTEIKNYSRDSLTIADLEKGLRVKVKGSRIADKTIRARRIKIKRFYDQELEFTGAITMLSGSQIQVEQTIFFTDSLTIILDANKTPLSFDQLAVGQIVEVKGIKRADGNLWALRIKIEDRNRNGIEFTGIIEKLSADSISVNSFTFFVDSLTNVFDLQGNPITFTDLVVGDLVEIKGEMQLDGSLRAVKIKLENTAGTIVVSGTITSLSNDKIWIDGPQYQLTGSSVILDKNYNVIDISQYKTGDAITLWAEDSNGNITVLQTKLGTNSVTGLNLAGGQKIPELFELNANYPNPFNPETTIAFNVNFAGFRNANLLVFDITGRKVRTLFSGLLNAGRYSFKWDGKNDLGNSVASGLYIYRLSTGTVAISKKMTLIR